MKALDLNTAVSFGGHLVTHQGEEIFKQPIDRDESNAIKKNFRTPFPMLAIDEKIFILKIFLVVFVKNFSAVKTFWRAKNL